MIGFNGFFVLFLAVISISSGGNIGRSSEIDNGHKYYENNPFFNSSYPAEQYRHSHYPGHHHHYGFYHNRKDNSNSHDNFPEQQEFVESNLENFEGPKITSRRDIADDVLPDYPYDEIRNFLNQNQLLRQYFVKVPKIGNRDGTPEDTEDGENLCKTQVIRTYQPQKLRNINQIERVIINDRKEYVQAIEEKKCANDRGACSISFDTFGYTSYCQQSFDVKRLMVFENDTKTIVFDEFRIPSCCICKIRKNK